MRMRTSIQTMVGVVRVAFEGRRSQNLLPPANRSMACWFRCRHHHRLGSYGLDYCLHHRHDNCGINHSILHWPCIGFLQLCVRPCVLCQFIRRLVHISHCLLLRHCNCLRLHLFYLLLLGQYHSLCHRQYWSVKEYMLEILGRHSYLRPKHCETLLINSRSGQGSRTLVYRNLLVRSFQQREIFVYRSME